MLVQARLRGQLSLGKQGSLLGKQDSLLGKQGSLLSGQRSLLPSQGSLLSRQGSLLPSQGSLLPKQGSLLPRLGGLLAPQSSLLPKVVSGVPPPESPDDNLPDWARELEWVPDEANVPNGASVAPGQEPAVLATLSDAAVLLGLHAQRQAPLVRPPHVSGARQHWQHAGCARMHWPGHVLWSASQPLCVRTWPWLGAMQQLPLAASCGLGISPGEQPHSCRPGACKCTQARAVCTLSEGACRLPGGQQPQPDAKLGADPPDQHRGRAGPAAPPARRRQAR